MRRTNDTTAAISAAATAEDTESQSSSFPKKRRGSCWSIASCFRSHKLTTKIGHAPEPNFSRPHAPTAESRSQPPPFIAPPSSPASFRQSEPPSAAQSPGGFLSFTPASSTNVFATGPYAYDTQLVSPPVPSTYTTEPSTAPFTPPPESVHLTTPSSPDVPFARLLLGSNHHSYDTSQNVSSYCYEFESYPLCPESPMGQLVSLSSGTPEEFMCYGTQFVHYHTISA